MNSTLRHVRKLPDPLRTFGGEGGGGQPQKAVAVSPFFSVPSHQKANRLRIFVGSALKDSRFYVLFTFVFWRERERDIESKKERKKDGKTERTNKRKGESLDGGVFFGYFERKTPLIYKVHQYRVIMRFHSGFSPLRWPGRNHQVVSNPSCSSCTMVPYHQGVPTIWPWVKSPYLQ